MTSELSRREVLIGGVAGLSALALPEWALPALVQDEELVPFTDYPEDWTTDRGPERRFFDIRRIGPITPADEFFTTQHYPHPRIDGATFRLKMTGLVEREGELSLDDIRGLGRTELVAGFECSGNSPRAMQGLVSNGRWTGVPLRDILSLVGVKDAAREVVFFGADRGTEEVEFRGRTYEVEQQYGRSISLEKAMTPEPLVAYALNGEPLSVHQGFPLRLLMPGWYGAPNVKWLANIHVQEDPYLGKYQARWYRTLRAETIGGELKWKETAITRMRLKSVVARVTRRGDGHRVVGFALSDGTPLRSVEVRIDGGPWQAASLDNSSGEYSWKLFTYEWKGAAPGEHTLVSRAIDAHGNLQPTFEELETKKTFLEDNSQHPRTVIIS
ncbi:MAG TPA: molybdopterin-dependent oxidoreductase [Vicinamibacteria bacterium]|nr:molybdopterin-dependent oxidoreductase [Vicinamibacteria bacterium]